MYGNYVRNFVEEKKVTGPEGAAAQDPKNVQEGREVPLRNVIFLNLLNCCTLLNGKFRNEVKVFTVICAKNLKNNRKFAISTGFFLISKP
jgi:hypothetical protein